MDCRGCLARFGLFIFNFIFMVSGFVVIFVGMLPKMSPDIVKIQHILTLDSGDKAFNTASTVLIIFGVVILLFAAFGFFYVCLPKKCSGGKKLFGGLYIIFLSLVLIGELGVEITAAVFKGKLDDQLPDILQKSLGSNYKDGDNLQAQAWDFVQVWLTCCGSKGPQDYAGTIFTNTNRHVPDTCCVLTNNDPKHIDVKNYFACQLEAYQIQHNVTSSTSDFINKEGCYTSFESQIKSHVAVLVGVGVGIVMLELLGIVLACYMCRKGDDNDNDNNEGADNNMSYNTFVEDSDADDPDFDEQDVDDPDFDPTDASKKELARLSADLKKKDPERNLREMSSYVRYELKKLCFRVDSEDCYDKDVDQLWRDYDDKDVDQLWRDMPYSVRKAFEKVCSQMDSDVFDEKELEDLLRQMPPSVRPDNFFYKP